MSFRHSGLILIVLFSGALGACAPEERKATPSGIASAAQLQQDPNQRDKWTYRTPGVDLSKYRQFQLEPVVVYSGPDGTFGSMPESERQRLAGVVGEAFKMVIGEKYPIVLAPGPDVARLRVTLLGVEETIGGLATISRLAPAGIAVNAVKGASGQAGSFTGSIEVAVEAFDSVSNDLLGAGIRRATPAVYDVGATLSTTETVRSSAGNLATAFRDSIDQIQKQQ